MDAIITTNQAELITLNSQPLDQNPAAVYLAKMSKERGRTTQRQALGVIADILQPGAFIEPERPKNPGKKATQAELERWAAERAQYKIDREIYGNRCLSINWAALRFQHTAAIRARLAEQYAPATARRSLSALRGVLKAAWRLGLMTSEDHQRASDLESVRGETLPAGRALGAGEIAALMIACEKDETPAGVRDAAMIACMYPGGLRREEVTGLDLADFDRESGALTVRHGKGNKARITYLANGAGRAMADWLTIRGNQPGALFWPINKGGALQPRRMTNQAVYNALAKRGELAGVADFSPHDLRRTFISDLLDAGADIARVAKLAGHASVTTTQRYDRRPEAANAKAAGLLHLPYHGRMI